VRIEPSYGRLAIDWRELWRYRELLYFLVWRDLKVRYKQTAIGVAWVILQPLFTMAIFTLFFGVLARMPSESVPYPLFCFAGLVPWTFLANSLGQAAGSVVSNANLITKVYFPRLLVPLSVLLGNLPDLALSLLVLVALMAFYGFHPPLAALLWLSLSMALAFAVAAGAGLWLAALNVRYRDVRHTVPFLTQVWFFVTPVVYPLELLPQSLQRLYRFNPMTGVVEGFRGGLLHGELKGGWLFPASVATALILLATGLRHFRRTERSFADVV